MENTAPRFKIEFGTDESKARAVMSDASKLLDLQFRTIQRTMPFLPEKIVEVVDITNRMLKLSEDLKRISRPAWANELQDFIEGKI